MIRIHIYTVRRIEGHVAGQKPCYRFSVPGGVMHILDDKDVHAIDEVMQDAKRMNVDPVSYLNYMINNEGLLS